MASDPYYWLARYYDRLFDLRRPFDIAHEKIIEPLLPHVKSACDLCCGTGTFALQLAQLGIPVFAVDLSTEMCRLARLKVRKTNMPVTVIHADMRSFRLPQQVDLITSDFDALNHVPNKSDLRKVMRCAARALRPGGHFAFDVNNRLSFEKVWGRTWFLEQDPIAMVMHGGHRKGTDRAWTDVEWFIRKGNTWTRQREHIEEVCWSAEEIRDAFAAEGFDRVRSWDAAPFFNDEYTKRGYRTFWRARRKPDAKG
ncbi:MAG: class I SAM-dependent methyltransferase [Bryobacteraceae bacterium]